MSYPRPGRFFSRNWKPETWERKRELAHAMVATVRERISNLPGPALAELGDWKNVSQRSGIEPETTSERRAGRTMPHANVGTARPGQSFF
jgi:hypothetical protein